VLTFFFCSSSIEPVSSFLILCLAASAICQYQPRWSQAWA